MEVIGGIKAEIVLNTSVSNEDKANVVEISAEDIQDKIKKEPEENAEPINKDVRENDKIQTRFQRNKLNQMKKKEAKEEKYKTDSINTDIVEEKLTINYTTFDLPKKRKNNNKNKKEAKKEYFNNNNCNEDVLSNTQKKFKNTLIENDKTKRIDQSEYSVEYLTRLHVQYQCNHCQFLTTSKRRILKHIRDNHRNAIIFRSEKENLKRLASQATNRYIAWFEYTLEGDDRYRCSHCPAIFQGQEQVRMHIKENHRDMVKLYQCPHCPVQSPFTLTTHITSMHTDEKDINYFKCDRCDFKAKLKTGLRGHIIARHTDILNLPGRAHNCVQCPKVFKTPSALRRHVLHVHNPNSVEDLKCFHCPYKCKTKVSIRYHLETRHTKVDESKLLQCPHCPYRTPYEIRLQAHFSKSKSHEKKVLQCHLCPYQCTHLTVLKLHLISHMKDKDEKDLKYRCDRCNYKTYRLYSLQIHKLNHLKPEEIQYFYCYHCNFKAKRKDNLKSHIFRHNREEVVLKCYICNFTTKKRDQLNRHIDKHSKDTKEVKEPKTRIIQSIVQPLV